MRDGDVVYLAHRLQVTASNWLVSVKSVNSTFHASVGYSLMICLIEDFCFSLDLVFFRSKGDFKIRYIYSFKSPCSFSRLTLHWPGAIVKNKGLYYLREWMVSHWIFLIFWNKQTPKNLHALFNWHGKCKDSFKQNNEEAEEMKGKDKLGGDVESYNRRLSAVEQTVFATKESIWRFHRKVFWNISTTVCLCCFISSCEKHFLHPKQLLL